MAVSFSPVFCFSAPVFSFSKPVHFGVNGSDRETRHLQVRLCVHQCNVHLVCTNTDVDMPTVVVWYSMQARKKIAKGKKK